MWRRAALLAIAFLSLTKVAGCTTPRSGSEEVEPEHEAIVVVDNGHNANVNVYLLRGGTRALLGKVDSMQRRTFLVPSSFLMGDFVDLRVVADAVGGGAFVSQQVRIWPGDEIKVHLTELLQRSWITVRPL